MTNEIAALAREMKKPVEFIQAAVELLDEGNTIPFITRFRKDQTGGLNEDQLLTIKQRLARQRALEERRAYILKSIEAQGKLDDGLRRKIERAHSPRKLEDLYLPFKPKKQSLAATARQQGLEPLANDIFEGRSPDVDLATRATDFVRVDKGLTSVDEVIQGVRHILAERFADRGDLRSQLREMLWKSGKLCSTSTTDGSGKSTGGNQESKKSAEDSTRSNASPTKTATTRTAESASPHGAESDSEPTDGKAQNVAENVATPGGASNAHESDSGETVSTSTASLPHDASLNPAAGGEGKDSILAKSEPVSNGDDASDKPHLSETVETSGEPSGESAMKSVDGESPVSQSQASQSPNDVVAKPSETGDPLSDGESAAGDDSKPSSSEASETTSGNDAPADNDAPANSDTTKPAVASGEAAEKPGKAKKRKRKRKKKEKPDPWADYFSFSAPLKGLPFHRVLAVNRGERAGRLKVRVEGDEEAMVAAAVERCIPSDHPFREFMESCLRDGLSRLMFPSLEREIRRELTEAAERHAVQVFARNLKSLLLQRPTGDHDILAIDPGFKHGCSVAVIDRFGRFVESAHFFIVGNERRRNSGKQVLADLIRRHGISLIAIGNGSGSRETEQLVSDLIEQEFPDDDLRYAIVNEAGASHYSTSELAREELPGLSTAVRSAVSIGRRLLDPLSELVKISPANIGVGLYQHDVKTKHLAESLDEVVQSCVNRVGVNVNTASPALLRYVSGLNQLTARRVYEYRVENGPFKNREELKNVTGIGDATFVQAAGFLKIVGGDEPLDSTLIHPESYPLVHRILEKVGGRIDELIPPVELVTAPSPIVPTGAGKSDGKKSKTKPDAEVDAKVESNESTADTQVASITPAETPDTPADAAITPAETTATAVPETDAVHGKNSAADESVDSVESVESVDSQNVHSSDSPEALPAASNPQPAALDSESVDAAAGDPLSESSAEADAVPATAEAMPTPTEEQSARSRETARPTEAVRLSPEFIERRKELVQAVRRLNLDRLAEEWSVGKMLLKDVVLNLIRPDFDPRSNTQGPVVRRGILKLEQVEPGMELTGMVVNVVDFGVFVDIGLNTTSLVHVSQLRSRFIRDPHDFYAVGDTIQVWVESIDTAKRQVKLTAIAPGERHQGGRQGERRERRSSGRRGNRGRPHRSPRGQSAGDKRQHRKPRSKPKPVKPISDEMLTGRAPMRSFSDLAQFFDKKAERPEKDSDS